MCLNVRDGSFAVLAIKATMSELCGPETLILLAYRRRNPDEWQVRPVNPRVVSGTAEMTETLWLPVF